MNYSDRFTALSHVLAQHRSLWQQSHFIQLEQDWQQQYPDLYHTLLVLTDEQVDAYFSQMDGAVELLSQYFPALAELAALTAFPHCSGKADLPDRLATDVPGRKWAQIQAFVGALEQGQFATRDTTQRVVDWCAGKSHLGRAAAVTQGKALWAIERDTALCDAGQTLSDKWLDKVTFTPMDVLSQPISFAPQDQVLALHACGDLHRKLIRDWQLSSSQQLILAPCCYHKWLQAEYQPLSAMGKRHNLKLSPEQVQLAVQEWVTASKREQQQTELMMQYRLAFDLLQRQLRGEDSYLPTPSLPYGVLAKGGEKVLAILAERKGLTLPAELDLQGYLQQGTERYNRYRRLQLVNHSFRRAIESWLVLDLILSLAEQGAQVSAFTFCERELSPRNLMIQAVR